MPVLSGLWVLSCVVTQQEHHQGSFQDHRVSGSSPRPHPHPEEAEQRGREQQKREPRWSSTTSLCL
ncbi:hypothetical protein BGW80DRAFT_1309405, partial [Lactifluus volemus]